MKKSILFLILLSSVFVAKSQFFSHFKIVEARAGLNISTVNDDLFATSKTGFHVGGMINYEFFENFSLRGGLMFSQKGAKFENDFRFTSLPSDTVPSSLLGGYTESISMNSYYLDIPIMASLNIPIDFWLKDASIQLNIGPVFSIGIAGTTKYDSVDYNYPDVQPVETFSTSFNTFGDKRGISRFDIGALMEIGFTWRQFALQFSYDYGFKIIGDKKSLIGRKGNYTGTNGVWMFTFAYKFKLNEE